MTSLATIAPVQVAEYAPGSSFGPRRLLEFEFVWMLRGSVRWTIHGDDSGPTRTHLLTPGRLAFSRQDSVDSYHWDPQGTSVHAYVHFELDPADPRPDQAPDVRELSQMRLLGPLCDYLVELGGLMTSRARERTDRMLDTLLDLYVGGPLADPAATLAPPVLQAAEVVRRIWQQDGLRIVGADELAAAVGMSTGHLFRVFRVHLGHGPAQALELVRLSRAARALLRSNATIEEVADSCGFAGAYHLSRRFSAAYGLPPGRFRRTLEADPLGPLRTASLLPFAYALAER